MLQCFLFLYNNPHKSFDSTVASVDYFCSQLGPLQFGRSPSLFGKGLGAVMERFSLPFSAGPDFPLPSIYHFVGGEIAEFRGDMEDLQPTPFPLHVPSPAPQRE